MATTPNDDSILPDAVLPSNGRANTRELVAKFGLAGASNMVAACFTNPFDLVKVRQQLAHMTPALTTTPKPWWTTLNALLATEGPRSIYKGLSASLVREGTYSGIRMGGYDAGKAVVLAGLSAVGAGNRDGGGVAVKLGGGLVSGMVGAAVANPFDLLKVRMQTPNAQGSLAHHIATIWHKEGGLQGLYRAVGPTTIRAGLLTSAQLGTYDHSKHFLMDEFPHVFPEGFATHFAASGMAGLAASAISAPVDVVKVKVMADHKHEYRGSLHCAAQVLRNEGPLAFYRGFTMSFLRLWPHSVLSLLIFEQLRRLTGIKPI